MAIDKIMVVIDPTLEQQPGFERALDSARMTKATLHLYVCINESCQSEDADEAQTRARFAELLQQLAERAQQDGLDVSCEVEWSDGWRTQVVRAAARCGADMVVKYSFDHSDLQREMRDTSDWTLLRNSPCPVLLIKNYASWEHRRILAAVNINSRDGAHTKLNNQIVSFAQRFADSYGSQAHFVNAYADRNHVPCERELAQRCGVSVEQIHVREGHPAEVISQTGEELGTDLIIIGTVGRSGIKGKVVGNTSERLLDHTHADVLVLN